MELEVVPKPKSLVSCTQRIHCISVPLILLQELSSEALQALQDLKGVLQAASDQQHVPQLAAAPWQGPRLAASLGPHPAALTNVPEQVAGAHNEQLKNRAPQYHHIPRNMYSKGVARPRRQPRDDIHVCSCQAPSSLFGALPARQPTQRQANTTLHRQMLQKAAGIASPAISSRSLHPQSLSASALTGQETAPQGMCDVRMTDNAADQATPGAASAAAGQADPAEMTPHAAVTTAMELDTPVTQAAPALPLGCGDDCLNRLSFMHCDPKLCPCGDSCSNRSVTLPWEAITLVHLLAFNQGGCSVELVVLACCHNSNTQTLTASPLQAPAWPHCATWHLATCPA